LRTTTCALSLIAHLSISRSRTIYFTRARFSQDPALHPPRALRGSASRTARELFLQGVAPHPTKNLFEKRFLELQKLLKMGVMYPPSHDEFTFPPLRRCAVFVSPPPRRLCRLPSKTTPRLTRASSARAALFSLPDLRSVLVGKGFAHNFGNNAFTKRFAQTR